MSSPKEVDELNKAPYILWIDYYSEGWKPHPCKDEDELRTMIHSGPSQPFVVTRGTVRLRPE